MDMILRIISSRIVGQGDVVGRIGHLSHLEKVPSKQRGTSKMLTV